jgi:transposase
MESKQDWMDCTREELITLIIAQREIIARLEERIRELESQIHKDSHNSHIPPSRSSHTPVKNMRTKTGKARGGRKGHKGKTLAMVDNPAHTVIHEAAMCARCGKDLSEVLPEGYERRQVFDIPPIILEVTEHKAEKKRCSCGHMNTASFPNNVTAPVQYGDNVKSLGIILNAYECVSYDRISELMEHLTGCRINESTLCSLQETLSLQLEDFEEKSKEHLCHSEVIHNDETGISVEGKRKWLHVASSEELTHYAIDGKRGKEATDRIGILPYFQGTSIHDGWKTYIQYCCNHGLCNAHHVRELTFFEEEEKAVWARFLKELLLAAKQSVDDARQKGKNCLTPETVRDIETAYDRILFDARANIPPPVRTGKRGRIKKTKQQNFIERLLRYKDAALLFVHDFRIPFDNNLAERDVRMIKLKQKVSGTFRSLRGAQYFARIRGYISTVRKNGRNVFEEIKNALGGKPFQLEGW